MLLVTGGAGFIGSNVVAALNDAGRADVAVCDVLGHDGKWRNLAKRQLADFVPPGDLFEWPHQFVTATWHGLPWATRTYAAQVCSGVMRALQDLPWNYRFGMDAASEARAAEEAL